MLVKLMKTDARAILPTYGSTGAAGADLYALADAPVEVRPGETVKVRTGIAAQIPCGYAGLVFARSGLSCKRGLAPANKVGVVDEDYRGEIQVFLLNQGPEAQVIQPGERIAQLVLVPYLRAEFEEVTELEQTRRGEGGFGSTGK